jgi:hypothetical protein
MESVCGTVARRANSSEVRSQPVFGDAAVRGRVLHRCNGPPRVNGIGRLLLAGEHQRCLTVSIDRERVPSGITVTLRIMRVPVEVVIAISPSRLTGSVVMKLEPLGPASSKFAESPKLPLNCTSICPFARHRFLLAGTSPKTRALAQASVEKQFTTTV